MTTSSSTKTANSCPAWCIDHESMTDVDFHHSGERHVHNLVLVVVGPGGGVGPDDKGGIFYFLNNGPFPAAPLSIDEARSALASAEAGERDQRDLAEALRQAIADLESVQ